MKNYLDVENLSVVQNKINYLIKDEKERVEELISILNSINSNLSTTSSKEFISMQNMYVNKMKLIYKTHYTDATILKKNVSKYQAIANMIGTGFMDSR